MKLISWLFLLFSMELAASDSLVVIGDAYELDGSELKYQEFHYYSDDQLDHRVVYKSIDDSDMAIKTLDYRNGFNAPSFKQEGISFQEMIDVEWVGESLKMTYQQNDSVKEELIEVNQALVVDAGFDYFIRENWQALKEGGVIGFKFAAPARLSLVSLQVKPVDCSYSDLLDRCFEVNSSNWLIRLLLDPIELGYDQETRQLSRFRGLSNIVGPAGNNMKVDIRYRYIAVAEKAE